MSGCIQCGKCCMIYGMRLEASPLDIARWVADDRKDILRHVALIYEGEEISGGTLWVDEHGEKAKSCPFLRLSSDGKYYCGIQEIKPEVCTWHYCENYYKN